MKTKSRKETTRHWHTRRTKTGIVPVRQHMMHFWAVKKRLLEAYKLQNPKASKAQLAKFRKYITPAHIDKLETQLEKAFHIKLKDTDKDGAPDVVDCDPKNPCKQDNSKLFEIKKGMYVVTRWENTRYGFRHLATLMVNGQEVAKAKECYYNRTWESFEYETVLNKLLETAVKDKLLTEAEKKQALDKASGKAHEEVEQKFGTIANVAKLGEVFGTTPKEKTDWKKRMLKAGLPALDFPEDWDTLSEETKEARLNAVIAHLQKKGG